MWQPAGAGVQLPGLAERHTELGGGQPGGDVAVRSGVHARIHPDGERSAAADAAPHPVERLELLGALHVEHPDARPEREGHLGLGLPHPGEDGEARISSRRQHAGQLPAGDDVEPRTPAGQRGEQGEVPAGLHRVAHQVRGTPEGLVHHPEVPPEGRLRVDVGGSPHARGETLERDTLGMQHLADWTEVVHRSRRSSKPGVGPGSGGLQGSAGGGGTARGLCAIGGRNGGGRRRGDACRRGSRRTQVVRPDPAARDQQDHRQETGAPRSGCRAGHGLPGRFRGRWEC